MSNFKLRALMGASVMVAASALAMGANAQVNGGGSTLLAPAWGQTKFCWDKTDNNVLISSVQTPFYLNKPASGIDATTTVSAPTCTNTPATGAAAAIVFVASGSGAGQAALFAHDGSIHVGGIPLLGFDSGGVNAEVSSTVGIQYGLSDNALANNDLGTYNAGSGVVTTVNGTTITTTATYQGVVIASGASAPKAKYGPLVQFPISIDPVDLAFNPAYDSAGHLLNLSNKGGKLILDRTAYCGIYNGTTTNWNDSHLATINGFTGVGTSTLTGGASAPIKVVGRLDSSGTTSIFTRHLSNVCGSGNPWSTSGGTTTLPTVPGITYDLQTGSGGVAAEIAAVAGSIGYLGNDYIATAANTASLPAATLINHHGDSVAPSGSAAATAFSALTVPAGTDSNPLDWVAGPTNVALGDPTTTGAYPIVGTTNFIGYTCYASLSSVQSLRDLLTFTDSTTASKGADIITAAGLAPLPSTWTSAINTAFLTSGTGKTLFFAKAGTGGNGQLGSNNATCTATGIVGG